MVKLLAEQNSNEAMFGALVLVIGWLGAISLMLRSARRRRQAGAPSVRPLPEPSTTDGSWDVTEQQP